MSSCTKLLRGNERCLGHSPRVISRVAVVNNATPRSSFKRQSAKQDELSSHGMHTPRVPPVRPSRSPSHAASTAAARIPSAATFLPAPSSSFLSVRPSNSAPLDSPLLNHLIKKCDTWQDMLELVRRHGPDFNFVHAAAAVTQLAQLKSAAVDTAAASARARQSSMLGSHTAIPEAQLQAWPHIVVSGASSSSAAGAAGHTSGSSVLNNRPASPLGFLHAFDGDQQHSEKYTEQCAGLYSELLESLLRLVASHTHQFGARQATNTLWALAHLHADSPQPQQLPRASSSPSPAPFLSSPLQLLPSPAPACLSTRDLAADMLPLMRVLLPWCEPQHLANTVWAVAKLELDADDAWLEEFLVCSERSMPGFEPQHLANTLWALSRLGIAPDDAWMRAFLLQLERSADVLAPIDVSHVLYGLASLGFEPTQDQGALFERMQRCLLSSQPAALNLPASGGQAAGRRSCRSVAGRSRATPQAIANSMWALATMSVLPNKAWMDEVFDVVSARLAEFEPQALSSLLWSAATLGQPLPPALMQQVYRETRPHLEAFQPRVLSNTIWAIATSEPLASSSTSASPAAAPLLPKPWSDAFLRAFSAQLPLMSDQSAANVTWALARLRIPVDPSLASAVVQHLHFLEQQQQLTAGAAGVSGQALANCLWGLAQPGTLALSDSAAGVLEAMIRRMLIQDAEAEAGAASASPESSKLPPPLRSAGTAAAKAAVKEAPTTLRPAELASVLYSYAKLRRAPPDDVLHLMLAATMRHATGCSVLGVVGPAGVGGRGRCGLGPQDLANTAWALSSLQVRPEPSWLASYWSACCMQLPAFNTKDLAQLMYSMAKLGWNAREGGPWRLAAQAEAGPGVVPQQKGDPVEAALQDTSKPTRKSSAAGARGKAQGFGVQVSTLSSAAAAAAASLKATAGPGSVPADTMATGTSAAPSKPRPEFDQATLPGMHLLLAEAASALSRCSSLDVANLSWGMAQMGLRPPQGWCRVLAAALTDRRGEALQVSHLSVAVWALGEMKYVPAPRSLIKVEGCLFRRMPAMKPRELAACAWSFAAMKYTPDIQWLDTFAAQCMLVAAEFSQQDWGVVVWSLAAIAEAEQDAVIYLEDLFISPALEAQVGKFSPATLAMLTYACGVLGTRSGRLMGRLLAAARPHMQEFKAQELSALVCTAARLQHVPDEAFVSSWLSTFEPRMVTMAGSVLAACGWALASLGVRPSAPWLRTYVCVLGERLAGLSAPEVSMAAWALGEWVPAMEPIMVERLGRRVGECTPTYNRVVRRNMCWALMKLKTKSKSEFRTVRKVVGSAADAASGKRRQTLEGSGRAAASAVTHAVRPQLLMETASREVGRREVGLSAAAMAKAGLVAPRVVVLPPISGDGLSVYEEDREVKSGGIV